MTLMSSDQVVELLRHDPARGGTHGLAMARRRALGQDRGEIAHEQRKLLDEILAVPRQKVERHHSPLDRPAASVAAKQAFSASDLAWLERLPADPAKIGEDDFRALQRLESQAEKRSGDERLIRSIIAPVRAGFARARAQAGLDAVKAVAPAADPLPAFHRALIVTVRGENAALSDGEVEALAAARVSATLGECDRVHDARVAEAERAVADAAAAAPELVDS